MTEPAIEISDLCFAYHELPVLQDINVKISPRRFMGIIGPNGGGKTTFFKLLMGFLTPQSGSISVFGLKPEKARARIGYVPQFHRVDRQFPLTVLDLVLMGALSKLSFWGTYPKSLKEEAGHLLNLFGLGNHLHASFRSLSGGMAQKALLARALLSDPDLLLLDEPTANIDTPSAEAILDFLESLRGQKTILLITHDLKTAVERVDQILCIQRHLNLYLPTDICEHFAFGLYHPPLLNLKKQKELDVVLS